MLYDIHCHLDLLKDPSAAIKRAVEAGFSLILTNGTNPEDNRKALELRDHDIVEAALGLYPNEALKLSPRELDDEIDFIRDKDPIAIGEVGLDYHWDDEHKDEMKAVFSRMLDLAEELDKPLLIHSRKAEEDVIGMLEARDVTACMHCFGGSLKLARRAARIGCYFSIPATITRSTHFQRLVEETPIDQLLTETDSPYLSPERETENEPSNVALTVSKIAVIKGIPESEARSILWDNAKRFLSLDADRKTYGSQ